MPLPFLDPKKIASSIRTMKGNKEYDAAIEKEPIDSEISPQLKGACQDLLAAIQAGSVTDMCAALEEAFEACEMEPHQEGEHIEGEGEI